MQPLCIVFPCYNEASRLRKEPFLDFLADNPEARFVFVDDGSSDGTKALLEELCAASPDGRASLLSLPRNAGKAEAVRQGMLFALKSCKNAQHLGYMDSDLATPLPEIKRLCAVLSQPGCVLVMGSRVVLLGRRIERSCVRHCLGRCFATCASIVLDLPVYDTQCGAKLFRRVPGLEDIFERPFASRWIFDVEMLARIKLRGGLGSRPFPEGIEEMPLNEWKEVGRSKVRPLDYIRSLAEMLTIWRMLRKASEKGRPAHAD